MTQSASTKSTSQPPSWQELEPPFANLQVVFWLILMTPSIVSLVAIWLLANMSLRGQVLVLTQVESGASTVRSGVEKFNTQVLSPSLKNLSQLSDAVLKTASEEGQQLSTFLSGIKKSEDIIVLKNNKGTEDNRVRKLDYSIQLSKLFYERFIQNGTITLFSPHDVPGLYDAFGSDSFDELYTQYESDESIPKSTIGAQELILDLLKGESRDWSYILDEH